MFVIQLQTQIIAAWKILLSKLIATVSWHDILNLVLVSFTYGYGCILH